MWLRLSSELDARTKAPARESAGLSVSRSGAATIWTGTSRLAGSTASVQSMQSAAASEARQAGEGRRVL
jgi:hypothetical protein